MGQSPNMRPPNDISEVSHRHSRANIQENLNCTIVRCTRVPVRIGQNWADCNTAAGSDRGDFAGSRINKPDLPPRYYYRGRVGSGQFCCKSDQQTRPSTAVLLPRPGRIGAILSKSDQENQPSTAVLLPRPGRIGAISLMSDQEDRFSIAALPPRPGRIGSAASQIGLVITTTDVTIAIGGSVEHCSAIPCHSMLWRDVTLQFVLYFDIVFDVIACS